MRIACWVSKATSRSTHTPSRTHPHKSTDKYVILIAFQRQQWFANAPQCPPLIILSSIQAYVFKNGLLLQAFNNNFECFPNSSAFCMIDQPFSPSLHHNNIINLCCHSVKIIQLVLKQYIVSAFDVNWCNSWSIIKTKYKGTDMKHIKWAVVLTEIECV
jgi:hypothetical protein